MPFTPSWFKTITAGFIFFGGSVALSAPGQSHPTQSIHEHDVVELAQSGGVFSDEERRIIRDVLDVATGQADDKPDRDGNKKNKGKNGKDNKDKGNKGLPPGIAMKLERGGTLPPDIAKRDLPDDLIARLPARSDGALRQIVGDDVVLIEKGTEVILDVIRGAAGN